MTAQKKGTAPEAGKKQEGPAEGSGTAPNQPTTEPISPKEGNTEEQPTDPKRKPWIRKSSTEKFLGEIERKEKEIAKKEEELKKDRQELEKLRKAKAVLEAT